MAELLRRHEAGEKLTSQEHGKIGAWKAKMSIKPNGRPRKDAGAIPGPVPSVLGPAPGAQAAPQTPGGMPGHPAIDPDLVRRTTSAVLQTLDGMAQRFVSGEALKAGADRRLAEEYAAAAALPSGPKDLMVQTSPEVCASMGLDSTNYPVAAFITGLGVWSANLLLVVSRLEKLNKERAAQAPAKPSPQNTGATEKVNA